MRQNVHPGLIVSLPTAFPSDLLFQTSSTLTTDTAPADSPDLAPDSASELAPGLAPDLAMMITGYPEPAVLVSTERAKGVEGVVLAMNTWAQALLATDPSWWQSVALWRDSAQAGLAEPRSTQHLGPDGPIFYDWQAIPLPQARLLLLGRDVTLERRLRQTLTESRQRYKDLVEISSDFAWETDQEGRFVFVSQRERGVLGFSVDSLIGLHPRSLMIHDDLDMPLAFESRRPIDRAELWLHTADGSPACVQTSVKPLIDGHGLWRGARGVCREITEQVNRSAELSRIRNRETVLNHISHTLRDQLDAAKALEVAAFESTRALEAIGCAIHRIDEDGSPSLAAAFGDNMEGRLAGGRLSALLEAVAVAEEAVERQFGDLSLLACHTRFRQVVNGTVCVWRGAASAPWDDDARTLIGGVADRIGITHAHLAYQERLRQLSERDSLTGLFNRRTFLERLEEMLSWRDFGTSSLLYIDLDNFKAVNDLHGHHQGDEVLGAVSVLIDAGIRPGDLAGRMGGDEFVLWLARTNEQTAVTVVRRLLAGVESLRPLSAGPDHPLGMSIGIAVHHPGLGETAPALIERADAAMYQAKLHGKGGYCLAPARGNPALPPEESAP